MAEYKWLFVGNIPLLYSKRRITKQLKIEAWLDLAQLLDTLGLKQLKDRKPCPKVLCYLV